METSGPTSGVPRLAATPTATAPVQWRIGQVLHATVADTGIGRALLAIGNRQVSAETSLALQKGEQLTLEVRELGTKPVLRLVTATAESSIATAVRQLLPRQGALPPLLANIGQLARTPNPPVPPLIGQLVRSMVRQIPDAATASTGPGLKQAVAHSGMFLERQLYSARADSSPVRLDSDFKANLLRLVQLVRNWPGSTAQSAPPAPNPPAQTTTTGTTPAAGTPPPTLAPAAARAEVTLAPRPGSEPMSPAQLARAVQAGQARPQAASGSTLTQMGLAPGLGGATAVPKQTTQSAVLLPPPLPGATPVPQAAVQASLDLLNRLGNLRTDLLQQTEAALARVQLHQLATLPREGERGLLEWLFELPVRHGDAIDLWSMRVTRDPREQEQDAAHSQGWSVQLAFDLPGLGPLRAQVRLTGEQISTRFWAEQADTLPLLRNHMHELRHALREAGLDVGDLDCQPGTPVADTPRTTNPLISEKA